MLFVIGRKLSAMRKFDPSQPYWHDAKIVVRESGEVTLITYWRNPEIAGIWEIHYKVLRKCFVQLLRHELIEPDASKDANTYTLSEKGRKRLSVR